MSADQLIARFMRETGVDIGMDDQDAFAARDGRRLLVHSVTFILMDDRDVIMVSCEHTQGDVVDLPTIPEEWSGYPVHVREGCVGYAMQLAKP